MIKRFYIGIILILLAFLSACSFNFSNTIPTSTINHISTVVMNANVKINTSTYKIEFLHKVDGPYKAYGSGVIIGKKVEKGLNAYYVLTNAHVIHLDSNYLHEYKIEDINNDLIDAELIAKNEDYDLALLKFKTGNELTVIELAQKNPYKRQTVFSVGSPSGKQNIITAGKIIAYSKIKNVEYEVIVHDALIYKGSSGSMLINDDYELVGINTWGFVSEDGVLEEDFVKGGASPIEKIREFLESIDFIKENG